jgi:hypothetical protein
MSAADTQDDLLEYMRSRFEKLDRAADEIKESTIRLVVTVATLAKEPVYSRVMERILAGYSETPANMLAEVVERITAEEIARANAE